VLADQAIQLLGRHLARRTPLVLSRRRAHRRTLDDVIAHLSTLSTRVVRGNDGRIARSGSLSDEAASVFE
jgi:hypothetical protein